MTLLVIDLGSSSVRTLLFDDGARLIKGAICSRKHDFDTDHDGKAVADADCLRALTEACLDEILEHPAADSIRALGMASFAGNWLGVDAEGRACTPVMTYADTRGRSAIAGLTQRLAGALDAYHQATGCFIHPAYLPAQYTFMKTLQPLSLRQARRISDIGGYFYRQWFGRETPISYSLASWSGLLQTDHLRWHVETIRQVGR